MLNSCRNLRDTNLRDKEVRNRINQSIKDLKKGYWEKFTSDMEHDIYRDLQKVWKMLRNKKKSINEEVQINTIIPKAWTIYFRNLYQGSSEDMEQFETRFQQNNDEK
ncbi:hypothetical protein HN011_004175 [Eciton burchellii]|nr:hypothetical protein HN011_004175 [Eciton burchellii]